MKSLRLALSLLVVVLLLMAIWIGWQVWHTSQSLSAAADDARALQNSMSAGDKTGVRQSLDRLRGHAKDADDRTGGATWSVLTHLPIYGDDAKGVRLISSVLDDLTTEGFADLAASASDLDAYMPKDGRVPVDSLQELQGPVSRADGAFAVAERRLSSQDASDFVGPLRRNYELLSDRVTEASNALSTAHKALDLLPGMLGADGPRNFLLLFQNNAEIRATGGLPGAWALITANDGELRVTRQGTAGDFPAHDRDPIIPLTNAERAVYGPQLGDYWQDANFTPDFTRSAELWHAWWKATFPDDPIDGIVSFDPVAMSYLLRSTGPLQVDGVTLTADNAVEELLSKPYLTSDSAAQDEFFAKSARAFFTAATTDLHAPMDFLRGLQNAAREGRLHLNSFDQSEQSRISGTMLEGALPTDDGVSPRVQIAINDATGSKMSYYLRYRATVTAQSCVSTRQVLLGSLSLNQTIPAATAASLPPAVTGGGAFGTEPGKQLLIVRIYSPTDGSIEDVKLDGKAINTSSTVLAGREVAIAAPEIAGPDDVVITWTMKTGKGQVGNGAVAVTPSVTAGTKNSRIATKC